MGLNRKRLFTTICAISLGKHILILLSTLQMVASECPKKCTCGITADLIAVNCEERNLTQFPSSIGNNTELLRFRSNKINELPQNLSHIVPKLKQIDLQNNAIQKIHQGTFSDIPNLHIVTLTANQIAELGGRLFDNVQNELIVSMTHNNITSLPDDLLAGFNQKISLFLEGNKIDYLSSKVFNGVTNIQYLTLRNNRLKKIAKDAFHSIHDLYNLDLASNQLEELDKKLFRTLPSLEVLYLQNNRLSSLDKDIFKGLIRLTIVDLRGNRFSYLPVEALLSAPEQTKIKMVNNPIVCDCNLASIIKNETIRRKIFDINKMTCQQSKVLMMEAVRKLDCRPQTTTLSPTTQPTSFTDNRAGFQTKSPSAVKSSHLPLLISIILGAFIVITITTVFIYLYRRPIIGRIVRARTLSYHKRADEKEKVYAREQPGKAPECMRDLPDSAFA